MSETLPSMDDVLSSFRLFKRLSAEERGALAGRGRLFSLPAGTVLQREGEVVTEIYCLLSGQASLSRCSALGDQVEVGRCGPGAIIGDGLREPVIRGDRLRGDGLWGKGALHSQTAVASTPVQLFALERSLVADIAASAPDQLERWMGAAEQEMLWHRSLTRSLQRLSHDMNSPLGVCLTVASHLKAMMGDDPALGSERSIAEPVDLLIGQLDQLHQLIDGSAALAACTAPEPLESMDLLEAIERTAAMFTLDRRNCTVFLQVAMAGPRPWTGFRDHLERTLTAVFANMIPLNEGRGEWGSHVAITVDQTALAGDPAWLIQLREDRAGSGGGGGIVNHTSFGLTVASHTVAGPLRGHFAVAVSQDGSRTISITVPQSL